MGNLDLQNLSSETLGRSHIQSQVWNILGTECVETYLSQYVCRHLPVCGAAGWRPGGWGTGTSPGLEPVSLPSDLFELPFEVPRFLLEPRGWLTTTSLGMGVVSPSTQHIPTTVILYEPSSATAGWLSGVLSGPEAGAEHRRRCGELARNGSHSRQP